MKAKWFTPVLAILLLSSCATGGRLVKSEFDDLYYLPSDNVVVNNRVEASNLPADFEKGEFFDNIYSGDTLYADQLDENVDFSNSMFYNKDNSPFEYMDDWSYSNRLRRFYGGSFYPYWRDPFYYSWSYYPWYSYDFYNPYWGGLYSPYFYDPFFYGGGYYGYYGMYYSSFYTPFSSYYSYWPTYRFYYRDDIGSTTVARRERSSSLTNSYQAAPSTRRSGYVQSPSSMAIGSRRGGSTSDITSTTTRRSDPAFSTSKSTGIADDTKSGQVQSRRISSSTDRSVAAKPEYNQVSRSYTPTYNNPRLSERPAYNTSRVSSEMVRSNTSAGRSSNTVSVYRSNSNYFNSAERRAPSSYSVGQTRTTTPSSIGNYSVPASRNLGSSSGISSQSRRYDSGF